MEPPMLRHPATQKVTVHIPVELLHDAQTVTGKCITETITIALRQLMRANAYADLRKLRGTIHFSINLEQLRDEHAVGVHIE